jgi:hypothetical protein
MTLKTTWTTLRESQGFARFLRHAVIVVGLLLLTDVGYHVTPARAERWSSRWMEPIDRVPQVSEEEFQTSLKASCSPKGPEEQTVSRLVAQLRSIRARGQHHLVVMRFFFSYYFMAISVVLVAALVSAIAGLFISKNGWANSNQYVVTICLTSLAVAAYFGAFPAVFQHRQNIADNKRLHLEYRALENEIMSYAASCEDAKGKSVRPPEFAHHVDAAMHSLDTFAIGFDDSRIPNYRPLLSAAAEGGH